MKSPDDIPDDEVPKLTAIEHLERLLHAKDRELRQALQDKEKVARELEGSLNGWRREELFADDGNLPLPRLELVYITLGDRGYEWSDFKVIYRMVSKHLLGHLVATPLSMTHCSSGRALKPDKEDLPFRDGAHAAHDSTHLQMPVYKLMPGEEPILLDIEGKTNAWRLGRTHRRM